MGKRIIVRARGKGGPRYKSPGHRFAGNISYPIGEKSLVTDIIHDPARDVPLAKIRTETGKEKLIIAAEGMKVGDFISVNGEPKIGNVLPISKIPKGSFIFAIENRPRSGPQLCLSPGTHAILVGSDEEKVILQMPSKKFKNFNPKCLATMGIPAGGGQRDKKMVKAGQGYYRATARNKLWPKTSAVKMNPVDHPYGGRTKPGQPKSVSRWASPGAKVGTLASRRTGRRKK